MSTLIEQLDALYQFGAQRCATGPEHLAAHMQYQDVRQYLQRQVAAEQQAALGDIVQRAQQEKAAPQSEPAPLLPVPQEPKRADFLKRNQAEKPAMRAEPAEPATPADTKEERR